MGLQETSDRAEQRASNTQCAKHASPPRAGKRPLRAWGQQVIIIVFQFVAVLLVDFELKASRFEGVKAR